MFLGVFGYEAGRAGAGGDPALPSAPAAAAARAPAPEEQEQLPQEAPPGDELGAPTTRQS